jgi:hypothetical protein
MNSTSAILLKSYQESYFRYTESLNLLKARSLKPTAKVNDEIQLSAKSLSLKNLGLKLTDSTLSQNNSNIEFKYNFADSLIQVQSEGNYNITEKSGSVSFKLDLSQLVNNKSDKISILPPEVDFTVDFNLVEKSYTKETGSSIQKPDMLTIIQQIVERVLSIIKDGQNKDIKLAFGNPVTYSEFSQYDNGKFAKMIYSWLNTISQIDNITDKDGKRDQVTILIPDEQWQIGYESRHLSINITNISISLKLQSGETQTVATTDTSNTEAQSADKKAAVTG